MSRPSKSRCIASHGTGIRGIAEQHLVPRVGRHAAAWGRSLDRESAAVAALRELLAEAGTVAAGLTRVLGLGSDAGIKVLVLFI